VSPRDRPTPPGAPDDAAARALLALVPPLRFAIKDGFAGVARLAGFSATLRGAVAAARAGGARETPALRGLEAEAAGFDALPPAGRRAAVLRLAAHLGALVPVPPELGDAARLARTGAAPPPRAPAPEEVRPPGPPDPPGPAPAPPRVTAIEPRAARRLLESPLASLKGVHPAPRALLEERGRASVEQALEFWPRTWQDRTTLRRVAELTPGDEGIVLATVKTVRQKRMRNGRALLEVGVADGSAGMGLVFFNAPPWKEKQLQPGDALLCWGKVTEGFGGRRQMTNPEVEKHQPGDSANFSRIVPIYPGPAGWQHPALRKLMKRLCDEVAPFTPEDLPAAVVAARGLVGRGEALRQVHFPPPGTDLVAAEARATEPFRRLIYEELFFLQLALARRRRGVKVEPGISVDVSPAAVGRALARLPFALTGSQRKVLGEITADMGRPEPMNRLLQGDVGSGKTAVAFAAALLAVESGWQVALMAPTEILAGQHVATLRRWLEGSGVEVALVGAATRGASQREAREAVRTGRARIAVGTHALLEEAVAFERLGLVVVDEQHRFGVLQRAALIGKGQRPDVLVMTATPIPRTLALAFYGDLDQSKITELPPGRTPVETRLFGESRRKEVHELARGELAAGRQVYVVYPLVAESEKTDLADATSGAETLRKVFAPHAVGLLHGQLKADEKQAVMESFRRGDLKVLVSTTVIEVGVDVPNATVMIVEHAERFGLSQLHQLRGRVGRGAARSRCLLVSQLRRAGAEARERLEALCATQDGFELARVDLKLRGPGELLGTRQSGQALLEVADLYRDEAILEAARADAFSLVEQDPDLGRPQHRATAEALEGRWAGRLSLAQVG
jgi:ATP-dependent DNA helicase RecG